MEKKLNQLRGRRDGLIAAISQDETEQKRLTEMQANARVERMLDPKGAEAKLRKIEADLATLEQRLDTECRDLQALTVVIEKLEAEIPRQEHARLLGEQKQVQADYRDAARRVLAAANAYEAACTETYRIFGRARGFASQELDGIEPVLGHAGLSPVWDDSFVYFTDSSNQRDVIARRIADFDRTLLPDDDRIAAEYDHSQKWRESWMREQAELQRQRTEYALSPRGVE
jgi:hypothetical protein